MTSARKVRGKCARCGMKYYGSEEACKRCGGIVRPYKEEPLDYRL